MFEQRTTSPSPQLRRVQMKYAAFFGAGTLLQTVCLLTEPHRTHRPLWVVLRLLSLALMLFGSLISWVAFRAQRRLQRSEPGQA